MEPNHLLGQDLGGYRLTALLGVGASAWVFRGESTFDPNIVRACKVILPTLSGEAEFQKRFAEEARNLDRLRHPGIVRFYGARSVLVGPTPLLVMELELLEGHTLRRYSTRAEVEAIPLRRAVRWVREAAEAVGIAHQMGIVHRDLKPDNIQLTPSGQIKVLDFGLARAVDDASRTRNITMQGTVPGTVAYMAPEVCRGSVPTVGADVYALGVTLFELITGRHPLADDAGGIPEGVRMALAQLDRPPTPVTRLRPEVPAALADCVARALAKNPAERFADAAQLAAALRSLEPMFAMGVGGQAASSSRQSASLPHAFTDAPLSPYVTSQIAAARSVAPPTPAPTPAHRTEFQGPQVTSRAAGSAPHASATSAQPRHPVLWVPAIALVVAAGAALVGVTSYRGERRRQHADAGPPRPDRRPAQDVCVPRCLSTAGAEACGPDGCNGDCGQCAQWHTCSGGRCVCQGHCESGPHPCGTNGCPGSDPTRCGICEQGWRCAAGQCQIDNGVRWRLTIARGSFLPRPNEPVARLLVSLSPGDEANRSQPSSGLQPSWEWTQPGRTYSPSELGQGVGLSIFNDVITTHWIGGPTHSYSPWASGMIRVDSETLWTLHSGSAELNSGDTIYYRVEPAR